MYIRTKDGVYEVEENDIDEKIRIFSLYSYEIYSDLKFNTLILKQSDNLAELCDEFVYETGCGTNRGKPMISKNDFKSLSEWYVEWGFKVNAIYGAIWTSKGLIYVAKINEKGKMELL